MIACNLICIMMNVVSLLVLVDVNDDLDNYVIMPPKKEKVE